MKKASPKLYSMWECIEHIEYPYTDKTYSLLMKIIEQNSYDKNSKYLYTNPIIDPLKEVPTLFINKYRPVSEKMYLSEIDNITTKYNDINGVKDYFRVGGYDKRNQIAIGRKYNNVIKIIPILLSQTKKYIDPSYVEENLLSKVFNFDENSFEFFHALANDEAFYKDPAISLVLDRIISESNNIYYYPDTAGMYLSELVTCFFNMWSYKDKNELNYNNLRKLGLFIKEKDEELDHKNPKVKQLSFFD